VIFGNELLDLLEDAMVGHRQGVGRGLDCQRLAGFGGRRAQLGLPSVYAFERDRPRVRQRLEQLFGDGDQVTVKGDGSSRVVVELFGLNVDLDDLDILLPLGRAGMVQDPIGAGAEKQDCTHVSVT
jgi:hypothetical protein